ncbi:hypothetical protein LRP88_12647 [Fusarium phalaenopsidis]|nr:hypothetical protein NCS56_00001900 [Fusarium sp. Ph1]
MPGNEALRVNPFVVNDRTVDIHITTHGSDWYYAVMSVMGVTMLVILGTSFLKPASSRIFHYILAAVAFVAMIEHYSMASNLGWVPIDVEWQRSSHLVAGVNRQIWWVRYCGWFLIWPLISLAILLTTAAPCVQILWTCFLSSAMAVMAVVGAVVRSDYKWGYYGFWIWAWLIIGYHLVWVPRRFAQVLGEDVKLVHGVTALWVWFLWMLYPVCWGISEGGNAISPDSEFIFYGILDCCLIPITSAFFLTYQWKIDPARLGLYMRTYDDPIPSSRRAPAKEKTGATNGNDVAATGASGEVEPENVPPAPANV